MSTSRCWCPQGLLQQRLDRGCSGWVLGGLGVCVCVSVFDQMLRALGRFPARELREGSADPVPLSGHCWHVGCAPALWSWLPVSYRTCGDNIGRAPPSL